MKLYLFVKVSNKYMTVVLLLGIKHSMLDLISNVNYCSSAVFMQYWSYNENDMSAAPCIFHLIKL